MVATSILNTGIPSVLCGVWNLVSARFGWPWKIRRGIPIQCVYDCDITLFLINLEIWLCASLHFDFVCDNAEIFVVESGMDRGGARIGTDESR